MWARIINAGIGIWLMWAPAVLQSSQAAANNDRIVGPVTAATSIVACWEVVRPLRWVNVVAGLWLLAAPWALGYAKTGAMINDCACGLLICCLALVRGKVEKSYGGGWSALWK